MARRIAVTGASGNVGTALLRMLAEARGDRDYEIVGIARREPPSEDVYGNVEWHQLDVPE